MEAVGAADDVFYDEEEEEVNCYDFEPLPTLLEDEVSEAGAGTEPPPPLRSPVVRRPRGRPAGPPASSAARAVRTAHRLCRAPDTTGGSPAPQGAARLCQHHRSLSACSPRALGFFCPMIPATKLGLVRPHCTFPTQQQSHGPRVWSDS